MPRSFSSPAAALALSALAAVTPPAYAQAPAARVDELRASYEELRPALLRNAFGRPLHLDSKEDGNKMRGEVHAVLAYPFAKVRDGLAVAADWCEILTLPFNVKRCEAKGDGVSVHIGRTPQAPVEKAARIDFKFTLVARDERLIEVRLDAPSGPLGTRDYRILLAATPVEAGTFMRMSYGYANGSLSKLAMQTYLATSGASKVGFSTDGVEADGRPRFIGGMRGVLERNTMRYFLAIDSYLNTLGTPPATRARQRFIDWFGATERYPRQLREMTREEYVELKERDRALARVAAAS